MDQFVVFISFFVFVSIGIEGSNEPLPAEIYWHKVLPNTHMPSALEDILHPDRVGIDVNNHKINYGQYIADTFVTKGYERYTGKKFYNDSDIDVSLFFLEKDLQPSATKTMLFLRTNVLSSTIVPRHVADAIPFSSAKLSEILHHFSIKPDTVEASAIKTTLELCEKAEFYGEHKFCATSLESLVESSMLALGTRNVQALSTTVSKERTLKQTYKVTSSGLQRLPGSDMVACHSTIYPFVVYYCHAVNGTKTYRVALIGEDGTKVEAVAVCHTETAKWDPEHVVFHVLKVKPGTVPICHILKQDNLLWTPSE